MKKSLSALTLAMAIATPAAMAQDVNLDALSEQIDALQAQINELKAQVATSNQLAEEASESAEAATQTAEVATVTAEVAIENVEQSMKSNSLLEGISIGGYGELHYNNLDSGKKVDFHRFVLFFGKEFNDKLRFFSELEVEHAFSGEGKPGEVELEQAYIEYDFTSHNSGKAGVFLIPVGIVNETHEPPAFFGVERNGVEKEIVPSTWWEAGTAFTGRSDSGFSYDLALHSGLEVPTTGKNAYRIRSGRQKVAKASAEDLAFTSRVRYTGIPGLELALTLQYQSDITQGVDNASATLIETHAIYEYGRFGFHALYADWDIDGTNAELLGKDSQTGYYFEPSYSINESWKLFARYGEYNTTNGIPGSDSAEQFDIGVNWYPHEDVVIKFDIQDQSGSIDDDGFNIGLGYQF